MDRTFEKTIETLKRLGNKNTFESTLTLTQYAELVKVACAEYGKERVLNALNIESSK